MKKYLYNGIKKWFTLFLIAFLVFLLGWFVIDRFCWRGFDYYFCGDPTEDLSYQIVDFNENSITLNVMPTGSAYKMGGYDYYIKDHTLYFAIKIVLFGGEYFDLSNEFRIETEERLDKVVVKGHGNEIVFYPEEVT